MPEHAKSPAPELIPVPPPEVAKGILYPREQERHRTLGRLPARGETARFIEWYWSVSWDLRGRPDYRAEVLPYPCVNLTFERTHTRGGGWVNGVSTVKYIRELSGQGETFGVKFRPGGFGAFTGLDVGALRDSAAELTAVLPEAVGLSEKVLSAATDEERRDIVEEFFTDAARRIPPDESYRLVLRIIAAMESDRDLTKVEQVTERFDIPIRTLQRLFRRYVGAGPKWVLRRYRLQDGAHLLAEGRTGDLAALALELGYFDQAHFSREFAREVGMSPLEYARSALLSG
ncbi:AraC family transcriptional regulator [Nocardia sp. CDC159]|uniref:AraC family transcriptional regulator n=1 Tax=Nocardia pulmonis TaxID=2951408 RepID=A0A9X2J0Q1_9NOCA|nr:MULTISPECIES: AraC family transcriptional regulator [Nocardia]MCM6778808.1 AraC family transcriptional regulator [Nocardia pulmonis]MCM6791697.1 AraC family transcriptional regulator [Nocardia sp. CDC159]